jgi:hypothetical protein
VRVGQGRDALTAEVKFIVEQPWDVRFGSLAEMVSRPRHVRYSLKADIHQHGLHVRLVPLAEVECA